VPALIALTLIATMYSFARLPLASADDRSAIASNFKFVEQQIALPPNLPTKTIRQVNPAYKHIQAWISSVGAGIAVNDLAGTGKAGDLCIVDPRSDEIIVTPAPSTGARYAPFTLEPGKLPMDSTIAPTGCVPGDFNGDGALDLLTYYMGRTPILYIAQPQATTLSAASYRPTELIPSESSTDKYEGPRWHTMAVSIADYDGDGHPDIVLTNYFPDSDVLDPNGIRDVEMQDSMSRAFNAGGAHVLRWTGVTAGPDGRITFAEDRKAIPYSNSSGWTLGAGSADLDGDLLPELYLANDFGPDHMFHNVSTKGEIKFSRIDGHRNPTTPKSLVLGHDSFKSMSVDFGDLQNSGRFDMFVSNITVSWGIEESNFAWINTAKDGADAKAKMLDGTAPFENQAAKLKTAWTGWGWDSKSADLDNSGNLSIVQTDGFVKGETSRWAWLQELAMANDELVANPKMWPNAEAGDDISGSEVVAFWARDPSGDGKSYANITKELGMDVPIPTRGVAVADTQGDGYQDLAIARQWGPPAFYRNESPSNKQFVGLRLYRPTTAAPGGLSMPGTPAYGAMVTLTRADGTKHVSQLDGGSGHSGKRSFEVYLGLGGADGPVKAELCWRDTAGSVHKQTLTVGAGWHDLMLDSSAKEIS